MKLTRRAWPGTVHEAVEELTALMSQSDRDALRALPRAEVPSACHFGLAMAIRNRFGLWAGNQLLLRSCMKEWRRQRRDEMRAMPSRLAGLQETARRLYENALAGAAIDAQHPDGYERLANAELDALPALMWPEDSDEGFLLLDPDTASSVIVEALWCRLQEATDNA